MELQTNLLQASLRNPASSGVLDEVFGSPREDHALCDVFHFGMYFAAIS